MMVFCAFLRRHQRCHYAHFLTDLHVDTLTDLKKAAKTTALAEQVCCIPAQSPSLTALYSKKQSQPHLS